jgi:hypothetical protein
MISTIQTIVVPLIALAAIEVLAARRRFAGHSAGAHRCRSGARPRPADGGTGNLRVGDVPWSPALPTQSGIAETAADNVDRDNAPAVY